MIGLVVATQSTWLLGAENADNSASIGENSLL